MNLGLKIFNDYWHLVCHQRELPNDGDFIKFKTPIGDVVIFNDSGEIVAFDNRCAHRGALIYADSHGNQPNFCNYHGWAFKGGRLIIPAVENFKNCSVESADLNKYKLGWVGGFIFLGIAPKFELYDQLGEVGSILENISFNIDRRLDFNSYDYECYWPIALENALEPYHIDMVHPQTLAILKLEDGVNKFYGANSVWEAPLGNQRIKKQLSGFKRFFNIDYQYEGYMSIYMFPFTMISSTFGYSYSVQNFFPHQNEKGLTNFTSRFLSAGINNEAARQVMQPFFDSSVNVNRKVFEEDHGICKLMPADSWSSNPLIYPSMQEEKIDHFRALCRGVIQ